MRTFCGPYVLAVSVGLWLDTRSPPSTAAMGRGTFGRQMAHYSVPESNVCGAEGDLARSISPGARVEACRLDPPGGGSLLRIAWTPGYAVSVRHLAWAGSGTHLGVSLLYLRKDMTTQEYLCGDKCCSMRSGPRRSTGRGAGPLTNDANWDGSARPPTPACCPLVRARQTRRTAGCRGAPARPARRAWTSPAERPRIERPCPCPDRGARTRWCRVRHAREMPWMRWARDPRPSRRNA
jgi:hypothetical protein